MKSNASFINYVVQISLIVLFTVLVIYCFKFTSRQDALWTLGVSSLASSAFIMFTKPHSIDVSSSRFLMSYGLNIVVGFATNLLLRQLFGATSFVNHSTSFFLFACIVALALGFSILMMLLLKLKHPPALGICLILIIDLNHYELMVVVTGAVLALALVHHLMRQWLKPL